MTVADEAIEEMKSLGEWQYADREALWKWMYRKGAEDMREQCAAIAEETAPGRDAEAIAEAIRAMKL